MWSDQAILSTVLAWTEPSCQLDRGVDHLGLRLAGEVCYGGMIDFTTTVSWRPRYMSFYCWAAQQAFRRAGGRLDGREHPVDAKRYSQTFKLLDFALAAATLVDHPEAERIVGSRALTRRLASAPFSTEGRLPLAADHVAASMGGFSVYAGPMRHLRLLGSAQGFDVPLPKTAGARLAQAFGRSIAASGVDLLAADELDDDQLRRLGALCGLDGYARRAREHAVVADELHEARSALCDWEEFEGGQGPSGPRMLTIGIILALHELSKGHRVGLAAFRSATLLGSIEQPDGRRISLTLPSIFDRVLGRWRMYQAHAFATLALESMLASLLERAATTATRGTPVSMSRLVREGVEAVVEGAERSRLELPSGLVGWCSATLTELAQRPWSELREPTVAAHVRDGRHDAEGAWAHDAALLLVSSINRMRHLRDAGDAWTGHQDPARLPPARLIEILEQVERSGATVTELLAYVMEHLVLHQHRTNALRKLLSQPGTDSARFALEGGRVVPLGQIRPGTSSPRYRNAVDYLAELGYLTEDASELTPEGRELLRRIERGGAP